MRTPKLLSALPGKMSQIRTSISGRRKPRQPEALEDLKLAVRDDVLWPVQDTFLALRDTGRNTILGAVLILMVAAGGYALVSSGSSQPEAPAASVATASKPAPAAEPVAVKVAPEPAPEPTLQGAAPVFKAPKEAKQPKEDASSTAGTAASAAPAAAGNSGNAATDTISSNPAAAGATASKASVEGPPAGPAAIAVARKFAGAFVVYETGGGSGEVRKAFEATAVPQVTKALLQRPPRQPAGLKVPKAKVLNVVPAPSHDRVYPVSVSLLRVGATSELRLEMEQLKNRQWRVTNVLG